MPCRHLDTHVCWYYFNAWVKMSRLQRFRRAATLALLGSCRGFVFAGISAALAPSLLLSRALIAVYPTHTKNNSSDVWNITRFIFYTFPHQKTWNNSHDARNIENPKCYLIIAIRARCVCLCVVVWSIIQFPAASAFWLPTCARDHDAAVLIVVVRKYFLPFCTIINALFVISSDMIFWWAFYGTKNKIGRMVGVDCNTSKN